MAAEKKAVDLGLLEEDDEFEEFPTEGKTFVTISYYIFVSTTNVLLGRVEPILDFVSKHVRIVRIEKKTV